MDEMEQLGTRLVDPLRLEERDGGAVKFRPLRQRRRGRIEIIPMIDVMFFLLATFMLASLSLQNLHSLRREPPARAGPPLQATRSVTLTVTRDGAILLDQTAVTLDTLAAALRPMLGLGAGRDATSSWRWTAPPRAASSCRRC